MSTKTNKMPSLEAALAEITQLVDKMEHSELTLEESLANFERGINLVKHCQKILSDAEQKVQVLMQKNGQDVLDTYQIDDEGSGEDDNTDK